MASRGDAPNEPQRRVSGVHFHPAQRVWNGLRRNLFLLHKLLVNFFLRKVHELAVINQFFNEIVHRSDVPTQQLVNAAIYLVLRRKNERLEQYI